MFSLYLLQDWLWFLTILQISNTENSIYADIGLCHLQTL